MAGGGRALFSVVESTVALRGLCRHNCAVLQQRLRDVQPPCRAGGGEGSGGGGKALRWGAEGSGGGVKGPQRGGGRPSRLTRRPSGIRVEAKGFE
jgi:hypothetical protein